MIGIYKITSPSGKIYIGQAIDIERRRREHSKSACSRQTKLYNSIKKYGYSSHIFEVIEECIVENLNIRERYWQDYYDVLGPSGLNCRLTGTTDKSGKLSEDILKRRTASTDYKKRTANTDYKKRTANTDWATLTNKRINNTDYRRRTANTDYKKRTANTDYKARTASMDYVARSKKINKAVNQYEKDGTFIKEWSSIKEAGDTLGIHRTSITCCCRGKQKLTGGFIWKYK